MANKPYGFRPVQNRDGSSWTGKTQLVKFAASDANATFVGDLVKFTGNGADGGTVPEVTRADPADARLAGAVVRFDFDADGYKSYRGANEAYVPQDRNVIYSVQEDSVTTDLTANDVEANIDFVQGAGGSTITGQSSYQLDSDSAGVAATLPLRIVRLENNIDNVVGPNAQWLVTLNLDAYSDTAGL